MLILGESGSGKSSLAAALQPNTAGKPACVMDCAALDDWQTVVRAFADPRHGTVLLERALDLPRPLQARLVGLLDASPERRVLATACVTDEAELRPTFLRQDLIDRLAVYVVRVPPLRERADEIEDIALETLNGLLQGRSYASPPLTPDALSILRTYWWPGNVRQLHNVLRRALLACPRGPINADALPPRSSSTRRSRGLASSTSSKVRRSCGRCNRRQATSRKPRS